MLAAIRAATILFSEASHGAPIPDAPCKRHGFHVAQTGRQWWAQVLPLRSPAILLAECLSQKWRECQEFLPGGQQPTDVSADLGYFPFFKDELVSALLLSTPSLDFAIASLCFYQLQEGEFLPPVCFVQSNQVFLQMALRRLKSGRTLWRWR